MGTNSCSCACCGGADVVPRAALQWVLSDDTGSSSIAICARLSGAGIPRGGWSYPCDEFDLGRCLRLLAAVPDWRERIGEMAEASPVWKRLVQRWPDLERSFLAEGALLDRRRSRPQTYQLLDSILRGRS